VPTIPTARCKYVDNPIILHVNYVEQGQTIEEMCRLAAAWGYDGIELRRKRAGVTETPEEYLDTIARNVESSGLKHVIFGSPGPNLMAADADVRAADVEECTAFYRAAAKRFDLKLCNALIGNVIAPGAQYHEYDRNGAAAATEDHWQWAVEGFRPLGDLASELGFRFAFEIHMCYLHDLPESTRKLVGLIDRDSVGINFDYGNIAQYPGAPGLGESLKTCEGRLYYVHVKNSYLIRGAKYNNCIPCPLADGVINNRDCLRRVKALGYRGPIAVEAPREGDREHFAQEDLAYLKRLMAEL
jgi:sugar phosphate isomerase/epimerase